MQHTLCGLALVALAVGGCGATPTAASSATPSVNAATPASTAPTSAAEPGNAVAPPSAEKETPPLSPAALQLLSRLRALRDQHATVYFRHLDARCAEWRFVDYEGGRADNRWREVVLRKPGVVDGYATQFRLEIGDRNALLYGPSGVYVAAPRCSPLSDGSGRQSCHTPGNRHVRAIEILEPSRIAGEALHFRDNVWFSSRQACEANRPQR